MSSSPPGFNGKHTVVTQETFSYQDLRWRKPECPESRGIEFRCKLCGHKFALGDEWRFVFGPNIIICRACDGTTEDVARRWNELWDEAHTRFWFLYDREQLISHHFKDGEVFRPFYRNPANQRQSNGEE
jgi:hypothetical protein